MSNYTVAPVTDLGILAKSLYKRSERRADRFRLQDLAADLLPSDSRTARCGRHLALGSGSVRIAATARPDGTRAHIAGVETCSSVWACPVCSAKISERRRGELNQLLRWAREGDLVPCLVTLTLRHTAGESLSQVLSTLKAAKTAFHNARRWRAGPVVGYVIATEVTHGVSGWHPHLHMLVILKKGSSISWLASLDTEWRSALALAGGFGNGYAYTVQCAASAGDYVAKWGAAAELALSGRKQGRANSRTVWELLAASKWDDVSGHLWLEYAETMRGRRQLAWSRGLRDACGLGEQLSDEDVAGDADLLDIEGEVASVYVSIEFWHYICENGLRAAVLDSAERDFIAFTAEILLAQNEYYLSTDDLPF